ncbi:1,3-beta-galactosyl-N-acetylhexosamine phosphorylase [Xylanimonas allomyrinae]|uniref:1,3-beta-galactosyl-N-acetylhexosamine phosphorylase n=1 Tax=Xylanimonas allomyrinae TaxID=2509459 RepID=A0A4V0YEK9_9MICO|nr:1,3-beta-galactosyl-N-acetylhexosamine phosphorylase [Xylanimonas allomyrinae]QAY64571.1 1,3-beta-galactosyl-N-acetylhexosamine phosphorylase [Xylanimonas allomyrinae]
MNQTYTGGFTLPGEAGKEALTLRLAERWGADVIRDSDGTKLSDEILGSGHGIYSTLCLVREDLEWAKAHPQLMQQNFLMSAPVVADADAVTIDLLAGFSRDQFVVQDWDGVEEFWQVHDRTTGEVLPITRWALGSEGTVVVRDAVPGHTYTVNFLVMRTWEEISMYNHVTNDWGDREHLMAVEPRHPEVAEHLLAWLEQWCTENPATTVVRFTSLFYNFAWFWGSDGNLPHLYADWASYDFTVNPIALRAFREQTGRTITAEDFVNAGRYTSTHNPPSDVYRAWMEFTWEFVLDLGRKCVDVVHRHGKKAYVFYDDSWVGLEPFSGRFAEYGFDGLIKAVFNGFEARLNAAVDVPIHELRLHPYLFPVDLEGKPTFAPGGDPSTDLLRYWVTVRQALVRARIDRIGLGGYLSLVEPFEDFQDAVARIADEHRRIRALHLSSARSGDETRPVRVGVVTAWGALRTWSTSGHFHENRSLSLMHVLESLAGQDFDVSFHRLDDIASEGVPAVDVLLNAGLAGSSWSGGDAWSDPRLVTAITRFVHDGGGLVGIEEPSAVAPGAGLRRFALADVLGVDQDTGDRRVLDRRRFDISSEAHPIMDRAANAAGIGPVPGLMVLRDDVHVLAASDGAPVATATPFGKGRAVYLAAYRHDAHTARLLENALRWAAGAETPQWLSTNPAVSVAAFADADGDGTVVVLNDTLEPQHTLILSNGRAVATLDLPPAGLIELEVAELVAEPAPPGTC